MVGDILSVNGNIGTASNEYGLILKHNDNGSVTSSGSSVGINLTFDPNKNGSGKSAVVRATKQSTFANTVGLEFLVSPDNSTLSSAIKIMPTGRVGIGNTAPASTLDVTGTATMTGFKMATDAADGYVLTSDADGVGTWAAASGGITGALIGNGYEVITTGLKSTAVVYAKSNATITGWKILSCDSTPTSGSIVVDIWKDTFANFPPTIADTITASAKPTLSSDTSAESTTLTGWTTSISAGDILYFNVDSATSLTCAKIILTLGN